MQPDVTATLYISFGIAFLAACLGLSSMLRGQERFSDVLLNNKGIDVLEAACEVSTDVRGEMYRLSKVDSLKRHPNVLNACYFATRDVAGLMDPHLKGCQPMSAVDSASAVSKIGMQQVLGQDECVINLVPKQKVAVYKAYETELADLAVRRNNLYITTLSSFRVAQEMILLLNKQKSQAEAELKVQMKLYSETYSRLVQATINIQMLTESKNTRTRQLADLNKIILTDASAASALESEAVAKRRAYEAALVELTSLQSQLDQLISSISSLRITMNDRDAQISRLTVQLNTANNAIRASQSAADAQVNTNNAKRDQCAREN
eukprot:gene17742-24102_t